MIPYFLVLVILAAYGMHRYWLVYCYAKYRDNVPGKPAEPATWPKVTIQLPIYNERYVIERLVEAVRGLIIRANCSKFRCSTIPPTRRRRLRALASSATRPWACTSTTCIAPIAKATRPARWPKG